MKFSFSINYYWLLLMGATNLIIIRPYFITILGYNSPWNVIVKWNYILWWDYGICQAGDTCCSRKLGLISTVVEDLCHSIHLFILFCLVWWTFPFLLYDLGLLSPCLRHVTYVIVVLQVSLGSSVRWTWIFVPWVPVVNTVHCVKR